MQIEERLLPSGNATNRPGTALAPIGLVIHTTANPGVDAEAHYRYWTGGYRASSAHLVVDWSRALTLIPWQPGLAEQAWHAGAAANRRFLGLEICETHDPAQAERAWANAVDVSAQVLRAHGWGAERLLAHVQVTVWYGGTDHVDPLPYFARWGRTWADFVVAVDRVLRGLPVAVPVQRPAQVQAVAIRDAGGRLLADGWLQDPDGPGPEGQRTVARVADLAEALGLMLEWDPAGPAAILRWPGQGK